MRWGARSGSYWRRWSSAMKKHHGKITHGATRGYAETAEYVAWVAMKTRCNNKNQAGWKNYGGRGITYCDRWESFENFLNDMGPKPTSNHTLDRINNDGPYDASNCKWSTRKEQSANKRNNRIFEIDGIKRCASEWADLMGFNSNVIYCRLRAGWSIKEAILTPKRTRGQDERGRIVWR